MAKKYLATGLSTITLLVLSGMVYYAVHALAKHRSKYFFGFVNKTGHDLTDVSAYFDDKEIASPGILVRGGYKTEGWVLAPIPPEIQMKWDETGTHHSAKAKVEGAVPKAFTDGTIFLIIKPGNLVDVKAVRFDDKDGMYRATE